MGSGRLPGRSAPGVTRLNWLMEDEGSYSFSGFPVPGTFRCAVRRSPERDSGGTGGVQTSKDSAIFFGTGALRSRT